MISIKDKTNAKFYLTHLWCAERFYNCDKDKDYFAGLETFSEMLMFEKLGTHGFKKSIIAYSFFLYIQGKSSGRPDQSQTAL